jgi:hypothetical protein
VSEYDDLTGSARGGARSEPKPPFGDPIKQMCWQVYWEGFKLGRGVESYENVLRRTALTRFERWWQANAT